MLVCGLWGCSKEDNPKEPAESYPIDFVFRTPLLDTGTRATLKDEFAEDDVIKVYGDRNGTSVFNGQSVTRGATSWSYEPLKYWNWTGDTDKYCFLAVYPGSATVNAEAYNNHISERVVYDYTPGESSDQYDLMMAGAIRNFTDPERNAAVQLVFKHMTSAVKVTFTNKSTAKNVTINSYKFKYLSTSGTAHTFINAEGSAYSVIQHWDEVENGFSTADNVNGHSDLSQLLAAYSGSGSYPSYEGTADLFVPQDLNFDENYPATLVVKYTPQDSSEKTAEIILKDALDSHEAAFTSQWQMGNKYTYNITFNFDGGIVVTVITSDWDTIEAETPGLLL